MSGARWIEVVDWDRFQHYHDRSPPWIKIYLELQHSDEWRDLSGHQRAVLVGLWLEYASSSARLRLDTRSLSARLGLRVTSHTLERLNHAGFIRFSASKPRARAPAYSQETETDLKTGQKQSQEHENHGSQRRAKSTSYAVARESATGENHHITEEP